MKGFTLFSLVKIALKHLYILILAAIVCGAGMFSYCHFLVTPIYSATASMIVTNGAIIDSENSNKVSGSDISASKNFAATACDVLKTNDIYKELAQKLSNKYTYSTLRSSASITPRNEDTLFIDISFTSTSKDEAVVLVNNFLELVPSHIGEVFPGALVKTFEADSARKVSPKTINSTFYAAVVGAALAYLIILIVYSLNTVIKSEEDFKERFDVPVLGNIPDFAKAKSGKYYKNYKYYGKGGNK